MSQAFQKPFKIFWKPKKSAYSLAHWFLYLVIQLDMVQLGVTTLPSQPPEHHATFHAFLSKGRKTSKERRLHTRTKRRRLTKRCEEHKAKPCLHVWFSLYMYVCKIYKYIIIYNYIYTVYSKMHDCKFQSGNIPPENSIVKCCVVPNLWYLLRKWQLSKKSAMCPLRRLQFLA